MPVSDGTGQYVSYNVCIASCNPPCNATSITIGNCTYAVPALSGNETKTITTTTAGYDGSATFSCNNGAITQSAVSCVAKTCAAPPYNLTDARGCQFTYNSTIAPGATVNGTLVNSAQYSGAATVTCQLGQPVWNVTSCALKTCDTPPYNFTDPSGCQFTYNSPIALGTTVGGTLVNTAQYIGGAYATCNNGTVTWAPFYCYSAVCDLTNFTHTYNGCAFAFGGVLNNNATSTVNTTTPNKRGAASVLCVNGERIISATCIDCPAQSASSINVTGSNEAVTTSSINTNSACGAGSLALSVSGGIAYSAGGTQAGPSGSNSQAGGLEVYIGSSRVGTLTSSNGTIQIPAQAGVIGFRFQDTAGNYANNTGSWTVTATLTYQ